MRVMLKLKLLTIFLLLPFSFNTLVANEIRSEEPISLEEPNELLDSLLYRGGTDLSLDFSVADIIGRMHALISADDVSNELKNFNELHQSLISNQDEVPVEVIQNGIDELLRYIDSNPNNKQYKEEICKSAVENLRNFKTYLDDEERLDVKRSCKLNCNDSCKPKVCKRNCVKCVVCRGPRGPVGPRGPQGAQGPIGPRGATGATGQCQICCPPVQCCIPTNCPPVCCTTNGTSSCNGQSCCPTNCVQNCCPTNCVQNCCPTNCVQNCCPVTVNSSVPLSSFFVAGIINYMIDNGLAKVMTQGRGFTVETLSVNPPTFLVRFLQPPFGTILVPLVSARVGNPKVTNVTSSSFVIVNNEPVDGINFVVFPLCR